MTKTNPLQALTFTTKPKAEVANPIEAKFVVSEMHSILLYFINSKYWFNAFKRLATKPASKCIASEIHVCTIS